MKVSGSQAAEFLIVLIWSYWRGHTAHTLSLIKEVLGRARTPKRILWLLVKGALACHEGGFGSEADHRRGPE